MVHITPAQKADLEAKARRAESEVDKLATKAVGSKYTSAVFLVAIIVLLGIGVSVPLWFD